MRRRRRPAARPQYIYGGEGCSLLFYRPGEYKYFSPSWPVHSKSTLTVEEDNRHVGTLYFPLYEGVAEGPLGMEFEYYNGFSRIHLGVLVGAWTRTG